MNKIAVIVGSFSLAFGGFAADIAVTWSASEQPETLADGQVVLTYEEGKVKTIVASPAVGDRVVVSGDEMALASGATITMENATNDCGALVFQNVLNGTDKLTCAAADSSPSLIFDTKTNDECFDKVPNWKLIFEGKKLDLYEPTAVSNAGKSGMANPNKHVVTNIVRETGALSFQAKNESTSADRRTMGLKVIKVKLRQGENGIEGAIENSFAVTGLSGTEVDTDIDLLMANPTKYPGAREYNVFTPSYNHGYGIFNLTMTRREMPVVQFENHVLMGTSTTENLPVEIGAGVDVRGVGSTAFGADKYTGSRAIDGQLSIVNRSMAFKSPISGAGTLKIVRETPSADPYVTGIDRYDGSKGGAYVINEWRNIGTYRFLADLTNMSYRLTGDAIQGLDIGGTSAIQSHFYHYELAKNGTNATCQVQCITKDKKSIGCEYVEFAQTGIAGVKMRVVKAGLTDVSKGLGVDFRTLATDAVVWTNVTRTEKGDGISLLTPSNFWRSAHRQLVDLKANLADYTYSDGAKIVVEGCAGGNQAVNLSNTNCLPRNGTLEIRNGGEVYMNCKCGNVWSTGFAGGTCKIRVYSGGHLWHAYGASGVFTYTQNCEPELWGGQLHLAYPTGLSTISDTETACGTYFSYLTLADGARVTQGAGLYLSVGNAYTTCRWKVLGHSPSYCDANLVMYCVKNNAKRWVDWEVWKTTDTDEPDFIVNGELTRATNDSYTNVVMRKYGAGKMRINHYVAQSRTLTSRTELYAGTWEFGVSGTSYSDSPYLLAGGTMEAAAGVVNDVGPISVTEASTIKVSSTSSLSFADSSGEDWTLSSGEHVIIDADLSRNAVRFGTSANGLTSAQQRRLRKADGTTRVRLDENGWARDYVSGLTLFVR